ncbi:MAG: site-specific DNA-methyltransferase [Chloroflexi bacterium]|nr:site-specific DNA-methyltransferase [Chloroflexota bacterium]
MDERREDPSYPTLNVPILDGPQKQAYAIGEIVNQVVQGDCLKVLKKLPDASVDLVFVDPPYYLQLPKKKLTRWEVGSVVEGVNEQWDKFESFEEYDRFIGEMLVEIKRIMKPTATIWVIATYHNLFRVGKIMQDLGYWILNDIIWLKKNPMPNWLRVRFTNATETMIWAVRSKEAKGYTFHKDYARAFGVGKTGANVWVIPVCNGRERVRDEQGKRIHSAQKPVELLRRVLLTASNQGDVILDPLAGVGTSGYVAAGLGRRPVMVEINPVYASAICERMEKPAKIETGAVPHKENGTSGYLKMDRSE